MKRLFDTLAPEVRRDLENVRRELAPRRTGSMLNTTFAEASQFRTPELINHGVHEDDRPKDRKPRR